MKFTERLAWAADRTSSTRDIVLLAFQTAVARFRWVVFPRSAIVVHLLDDDWALHPWGVKWRFSGDALCCPKCGSLHPLTWLEIATENVRWTPKASVAETERLIESGDLQDTHMNRMRAMHIPDGSARFLFVPARMTRTGHDLLIIETSDAFFRLAADHIGELMDDDFEEFQVWFSENMPEISIHRQGASVCVHYDPSTSPEPLMAAGAFINMTPEE